MSILIDLINARAHSHKTATDCGTFSSEYVAAPPATEEQVAAAEQTLGFQLPPLLRELYLKVGNGGFGPGYGLYGVPTPADGKRETIVSKYLALRKGRASAPWPEPLLSICTWGCGIDSSLDCSDPSILVIRHDPNMKKADVADRVPVELRYKRATEVNGACWLEWASFEDWLQAWIDGQNLFYLAYGGSVEDGEDDEENDEE